MNNSKLQIHSDAFSVCKLEDKRLEKIQGTQFYVSFGVSKF